MFQEHIRFMKEFYGMDKPNYRPVDLAEFYGLNTKKETENKRNDRKYFSNNSLVDKIKSLFR